MSIVALWATCLITMGNTTGRACAKGFKGQEDICKIKGKHVYLHSETHVNFMQRSRGAVAWWLTYRTPVPEVGGFEPHSGRRVVSFSKICLPPPPPSPKKKKKKKKVLLIPMKRWLRPNMTEKCLPGY